MRALSIDQATERIEYYANLMIEAMAHEFKFTTVSVYLDNCAEGIETVVRQYESSSTRQLPPKPLNLRFANLRSNSQNGRN